MAIPSNIAIKDDIDEQETKSNSDEGPSTPILAIRLNIITGLETKTSPVDQIEYWRPKNTEWQSHAKKCHYVSDLVRLDNLGHCRLDRGGDNAREKLEDCSNVRHPVVVIRSY